MCEAESSSMQLQLRQCGFKSLVTMRNVPLATSFILTLFETHLKQHVVRNFLDVLCLHEHVPSSPHHPPSSTDDPSEDNAAGRLLEGKLHEALRVLCDSMQWHTHVLTAVADAVVEFGGALSPPVVANATGMAAAYFRTLQAILLQVEPCNLCNVRPGFQRLVSTIP